jgi:tetratricopeptide (TPR) repeat protein/tRNA A-37 threonylcarbamoyl transferase component Bud32
VRGNDPATDAPRAVGRYLLYAPIASGGMASVHLGRLSGPSGFGRVVAIKRLHPHLADDAHAVRSFIDEARLAARIRHPNVVSTLDVVEEDGEVFIVMDYVHGVALSKLLAAHVAADVGPVPIGILAGIFAGALHGLQAAHDVKNDRGEPFGLVHRDISPQNLIVGTDGLVRVADFGIAMASGRLAVTQDHHQIKGKVAYMAPEQLEAGPVDARTDVYAMGVVLWESLVLRRLFPTDASGRLLASPARDRIEAPSVVAPGVADDLDDVVVRAMRRDPADRFPTARAMAEAIEAAVPLTQPSGVGAWVTRVAPAEIARNEARLRVLEGEEGTKPQRGGRDLSREPADGETRRVGGSGATPSTPDEPTTRARPNAAGRAVEPPRSRRGIAAALVALAAIAGAVVLWQLQVTPADRAEAASPDAPVTLLDLPPPRSTHEGAVDAYRRALEALHDGAIDVAVAGLREALAADDSLAAAHMRLAYLVFHASTDESRAHFVRALRGRTALDERDRAVLDALEPLILSEPADYAELERRVTAAVERFPNDVELEYVAGRAAAQHASPEEQIAQLDRVLSLDPDYALARAAKAETELYAARLDDAAHTVDVCLERTPTATYCWMLRCSIDDLRGECARLADDARRAIEVDGSAAGQRALASALYALGEEAAAEAALDQLSVGDPPAPEQEREDRITRGVLTGDLDAALEAAIALEDGARASPRRGDHARAAWLHVQLLLEAGDPRGAADIARAYLERRDGWMADSRREDFAMLRDPAPAMARVAVAGGAMTADEAAPIVAAWRASWDRTALPGYRGFVWLHGWVSGVSTRDEALEAIEALPRYGPVPIFRPLAWGTGADIARAYLLAGRTEDAITAARVITSSCSLRIEPLEHLRASLVLGEALEATADTAGACAAYGAVVRRAGSGRSVTAARARERATALGCPDAPR